MEQRREGLLVYHALNGEEQRRSVANGCAKGPVPIWREPFDAGFIALMKKYPTTVEVIFAGHTHRDDFRLISDGKTGSPMLRSTRTRGWGQEIFSSGHRQLVARNESWDKIVDSLPQAADK